MEAPTPDDDFFVFQLDRWPCEVCGQLNDDDTPVCIRCGAERTDR
ncbi:MAG TPA: hypothetical protein VFP61_10150 [Acidimicrobiales bacterium]|nr:hypothetical protein [Acidimicrobiales bacterium]